MLPIGVVLFVWVPDGSFLEGGVFGVLGTAAGMAMVAQLGRDAGKREEGGLWESWGGPPTTRLLRFRTTNNEAQLRVWRAKLESLTHRKLPTKEEEAADPAGADQEYEAAVNFLREATRDAAQFPLVFAENVNYGFRRNLFGWRRVGVSVALVGSLVSWAMFIWFAGFPPSEDWVDGVIRNPDAEDVTRLVGSAANTIAFAVWVLVVKPDWVKTTAEAYAERLLSAVHLLAKEIP